MKKMTKDHLAVFEKEARLWIDKLKLDQWELYFRLGSLENDKAQIWINYEGRVVTFVLSDEWKSDYFKINHSDLKNSAKHEAIELLMAPLTFLGSQRFLSEEEYNAAREEVVRKLEKLL